MSNNKIDFFAKAKSTGSGLLKQEGSLTAMMAKGKESKLSINDVRPRQNPATREVDPMHALDLAESMAVLGQLESLVLDSNNCLLAGAHRLCALQFLAASVDKRATAWKGVGGLAPEKKTLDRLERLPHRTDPIAVNVIPFDSSTDRAKAMAIELAENERRKNYSREETKLLAEKLRAAGYRTTQGRPRPGEPALIPALSAALGKSRATVFRMLADSESDTAPSRQKLTANTPEAEDRRLLHALRRWMERRMEPSPTRPTIEEVARTLEASFG